jgi:predicted amidophosphoribosyltransferase
MESGSSGSCIRCGYDLRGAPTPICPECGTPVTVPVHVSTDVCSKAADVLRKAGLLIDSSIGVDRNDFVYVALLHAAQPRATLWVAKAGFERACDLLEAEGIATPRTQRPIQDRSEPFCPSCGEPLDPNGSSQCPRCLLEFVWVTIEEPALNRTGLTCTDCGYDLTGGIADCCPECGASLPVNADVIVSNAAREAGFPEDHGENSSTRARQGDFTISLFACIGIALLLSSLFISLEVFEGEVILSILSAVVGIGAVILAVVLARRPRGS